MTDQTKFRYLKVPEGETVTIRLLDPLPTHTITMSVEELERYRKLNEEHARDCPHCKAGTPTSRLVAATVDGKAVNVSISQGLHDKLKELP